MFFVLVVLYLSESVLLFHTGIFAHLNIPLIENIRTFEQIYRPPLAKDLTATKEYAISINFSDHLAFQLADLESRSALTDGGGNVYEENNKRGEKGDWKERRSGGRGTEE